MRNALRLTLLAAVSVCVVLGEGLATVAPAQTRTAPATRPATRPTSLLIRMENGKSATLDAARFQELPRKTVKATNRDGIEVAYSGVALAELLALVATPAGDQLHGEAMAHYIVAEGSDGYRVTLSIAEVDDAFGERFVLVADQLNGGPLPGNAQPLQLIVPQDKRFSRWVRSLTKIEVHRAP